LNEKKKNYTVDDYHYTIRRTVPWVVVMTIMKLMIIREIYSSYVKPLSTESNATYFHPPI